MLRNTYLGFCMLLAVLEGQANGFLFVKKKRDCIITPWSDWKNCKSSGGNFEELRERFSTPPRNGGKSCPANLTLKESRQCGSDGASTNLMLAAFGQLAFGYVGTGPKGGKKCNKLRDANNRLIAAGGCSSGKGKRSIADVIPFYSRYRRQTTENFRDVLFLIDRSGSITNAHVQKTRDMAAALVHVFCGNIELGRTRVAVSTFNHQYQPNLIPFNRYIRSNQKPALELAIRNLSGAKVIGTVALRTKVQVTRHDNSLKFFTNTLRQWFSSSGGTKIGDAMEKARTQTLKDTSRGARHGDSRVKKMIILISDGCSYGGLSTQIAAQRLIADKVEVMVVYVGTDESCKAKILKFDSNMCYAQFYYQTWAQLVGAVNTLMSNNCQLPVWSDLTPTC